jgi:hypothetical protein
MRGRIADLAARQLGLITWQQLLEMGVSRETIKRWIRNGTLASIHRGVYRLPGYPITWDQRCFAALLAAGGFSALSFQAAGMYWEAAGVRAETPHITIVDAQKLRLPGVIVHRTRLLAPGDIVRRTGLRVTSPYRTIIDLAGVLAPDVLEDALDDLVRRRLVSVRALAARLEIRGRRGVRGVRSLAALLAARDGQRRKASGHQNRFRRDIERAGLPTPLEEHDIYDEAGRWLARVDFAYPERKVYVEIDGSHHETPKQWRSDVARQNRLALSGWRPLRFTKPDLDARRHLAEVSALFRSAESRDTEMRPAIPQKRRKRQNGAR